MFVINRLHANNTAFSCLPLFPVLVSAKITTSNDQGRSMTATMHGRVSCVLLVVTQSVIQVPFLLHLEGNGFSSQLI